MEQVVNDKWNATIADERIHGTTHMRPIERFGVEREALMPIVAHGDFGESRRLTRPGGGRAPETRRQAPDAHRSGARAGAAARNARQRFASPGPVLVNRWVGPPEVEVRDLTVYEIRPLERLRTGDWAS